MECLNEVEDPRQASNGTRHDFQEILVIAICAMLSDSDSVEDFSEWGRLKLDWLRRFLVLKNGIPSQDTFLRVFRALDPKQFEAAFRRWTGGIVGALDGSIAIDGKTLRRSADGNASPVHMVSAFATDLGLVLGQEKVSGKSNEITAIPELEMSVEIFASTRSKSNEITAIPELLEALHIKGLLVSIDAMGCQREIAEKIVHKGGDYLLAVKGNQPTLYQQVRDLISDAQGTTAGFEHVRHDHGRTVLQLSWSTPSGKEIDTALWPGCKSVGCVVSQRIVGEKVAELEERYYISSRPLSAEQLARTVRAHWAIENKLHWMLDVCFGEDDCMIRKDNAPQNLSLLKKIVLNLIRADKTDTAKTSLRLKRKRAAWDDDIRMKMLGIQALDGRVRRPWEKHMKHALARLATSAPLLLALSAPASAAVIDFTGGTATLLDATTQTTNNSVSWQGVDYYEENGFRLDFIPNTGSTGFSTNLGDYYGAGNDVIHAHWATGNFGGVEAIEITKIGGGTFDLNYFILTSNTDVGGSAASGLERAFVEGFLSGVSTGAPVLLPPEDWGFPATPVFLGSEFDSVDKVRFFVTNAVDCFGMDEFFIDEPAPGTVPEPASLALLGMGLAAGLLRQRREPSSGKRTSNP